MIICNLTEPGQFVQTNKSVVVGGGVGGDGGGIISYRHIPFPKPSIL
jgi:hypothetical protein